MTRLLVLAMVAACQRSVSPQAGPEARKAAPGAGHAVSPTPDTAVGDHPAAAARTESANDSPHDDAVTQEPKLVITPLVMSGLKTLPGNWSYSDGRLLVSWTSYTSAHRRNDWELLTRGKWFAASLHPRAMPIAGLPGDEYWGFADRDGNVVVDLIYYDANFYSEGLAAVSAGPHEAPRWGMIDLRGEVVVPFEYDWLGCMSEGLVPFAKGDKVGYMDREQRVRIQPRFGGGYPFYDGRAIVTLKRIHADLENVEWRWIDKQGRIIRKVLGEEVGALEFWGRKTFGPPEPFEQDGRWGYRDEHGKVVIAPRFANAAPFAGGFGSVDTVEGDGQSEYIDAGGHVVFTVPRDGISFVSDGRILRYSEQGPDGTLEWAVYDATGKLVFDEIKGAQWPPRHIVLPADQNSDTAATAPPPHKKAPKPKTTRPPLPKRKP